MFLSADINFGSLFPKYQLFINQYINISFLLNFSPVLLFQCGDSRSAGAVLRAHVSRRQGRLHDAHSRHLLHGKPQVIRYDIHFHLQVSFIFSSLFCRYKNTFMCVKMLQLHVA